MARKNINVKTGDTTTTLTTENHIKSIWGGEVQLGDQVIGTFTREATSVDRPLTRKERGMYIGFGQRPPATTNIRVDLYHGVAANGATITGQKTRLAVLRFLLAQAA